jgi:hypothetical protein
MAKKTPLPTPANRLRILNQRQALKMAGSAHAYVRASICT